MRTLILANGVLVSSADVVVSAAHPRCGVGVGVGGEVKLREEMVPSGESFSGPV